ncbi:MAG TPA: hypothetical protein VLS45_05495 [Methylomicrobium sp.]|nr:hypothetical protein [Methylomicrobium sp.]
MSTSASIFPPPAPLKLGGDIAADWERFESEWANYEIATDLAEVPEKKRAAIFLACIGTGAYAVFRTFKFENETDKSKVEMIMEAFKKHCIGEVNVTYERYLFHQRVQQAGESFENFCADLRKLASTCQFETLEDSLVRDRIVIGIRDEPTRRRLLQSKKLTLAEAVEACKASEATSRRLRVMGGAGEHGEVDALGSTSSCRGRRSSPTPRDRPSYRVEGDERHCFYCDRWHSGPKESCPAYGQKCRRCSRFNHFDKSRACKSSESAHFSTRNRPNHREICQIEDDELLALHTADDNDSNLIYCYMNVCGRNIRFLLDCGSTANVLPLDEAAAINPKLTKLRPAEMRPRMFDDTELETLGVIYNGECAASVIRRATSNGLLRRVDPQHCYFRHRSMSRNESD